MVFDLMVRLTCETQMVRYPLLSSRETPSMSTNFTCFQNKPTFHQGCQKNYLVPKRCHHSWFIFWYLEEKLSHLCEFGGVLFEAVEVIFGQDEESLFPSANKESNYWTHKMVKILVSPDNWCNLRFASLNINDGKSLDRNMHNYFHHRHHHHHQLVWCITLWRPQPIDHENQFQFQFSFQFPGRRIDNSCPWKTLLVCLNHFDCCARFLNSHFSLPSSYHWRIVNCTWPLEESNF